MMQSSAKDRAESGLAAGEVWRQPAERQSVLRAYVLAVLIFPFLLLAFGLYMMSSSWYRRHTQSVYLASIGYGARLHNANCQIVVVGDSTAMENIDPSILESRTGFTACNIAEVQPVQMVNGTYILDEYLKHNTPPRYIVFVESPQDLENSPKWEYLPSFEGVYYRMRDVPHPRVLWMVMRHPEEMVDNAEKMLSLSVRAIGKKPLDGKGVALREAHHGMMSAEGKPITGCQGEYETRSPDPSWLAFLRQRYQRRATRVLIDVTPLPACAPTLTYYRDLLPPGMLDNQMGSLPVEMFSDSGSGHMMRAGSEWMSNSVADQIIGKEQVAH